MICMKIRCAHRVFIVNVVCITGQEYLARRHLQTLSLDSLPSPFPSIQEKQKQMPSTPQFPTLLIFLQFNHEKAFNAV